MVPRCYLGGRSWKELVTVSSICSYWRNTFLATPSIWTRLDGRGVERTRARVRRSGALPLQLIAETGSPDLQVLEVLAPHFSRLNAVVLPCLTAKDRPLITHNRFAELLRPSPILRIIQLRASRASNAPVTVTVDGEFPSLINLLIFGIRITFKNLHTPNLTHVHISGTFDPMSLLDFLEASPLLEFLSLVPDYRQDMTTSTRRKVVLGKLTSLTIFHHGPQILQHLSLPPSGHIKIFEAISPDQLDRTTSGRAQLLSQALDNLPVSRQANSLSFHTTDISSVVTLGGPNGTFELDAKKINIPTACITLLRLLAQNSSRSIRDLKITKLELLPRDSQVVSDFVRSLDGLHSLAMHRASVSPWISALGTSLCPRLQDLAFEYPSPWSADYHLFLGFAKDRSEAGVPIQRLIVVNRPDDPLDAVRMGVLREYVSRVAWT